MSNQGGPNQLSIVVKGRVISGDELREYAERNGMCPICGLYQTHKISKGILKTSREPLTVTSQGRTTVYKGFCIQATCYSLEQAKEILGEKRKSTSSRTSSGTRDFSSPVRISRTLQLPSGAVLSPPMTDLRASVSSASGAVGEGTRHSRLSESSAFHGESPLVSPGHARRGVASLSVPFSPLGSRTSQTSARNLPPRNSNASRPSDSFSDTSPSFPRKGSSAWGENSLSETAASRPLIIGENLSPDTILYEDMESVEDPVLAELRGMLNDSNYLSFFNTLDSRGTNSEVVEAAFQLFRKQVAQDQMARPDGVVMVGDSWGKLINEKILHFHQENERNAVMGGLATLLTVSRLPGTYKKTLIKRDSGEVLMKLLDERSDDGEIIETCCSVIISLSMQNEPQSLNARSYLKIVTLIRKLFDVITTPSRPGKRFALRALYHISSQRKKSETTQKPALYDIRNVLCVDRSVGAVLNVIEANGVPSVFVEAGLGLLWRVSSLEGEDGVDELTVSEAELRAIINVIERSQSEEVYEAGFGLLANLVLLSDAPVQCMPRAVDTIVHVVVDPSYRTEAVATTSVHALCNILSNVDTKSAVLLNPEAMQMVMMFLQQFPDCEELVENACLAIGYACNGDTSTKESMVALGAFGLVRNAFESFVTSRGDDPSFEVKDAALCAMATLSGCESGARELTNSGLLDLLQAMLAVETDSDFQLSLQVIITNSNRDDFAAAGGGVFRHQPGAFAQLLFSCESDEEATSYIGQLRELRESGMVALEDQGFDAILAAMDRFGYSVRVQEESCALLAEIYYRLPLTALEGPVQIPGGNWAVVHRRQAVHAIINAMNGQRSHCGIQKSCCNAMISFLSPFCDRNPDETERQTLSGWLQPLLRAVVEAISAHGVDMELLERAISLYWLLTYFCRAEDLSQWTPSVLQLVLGSLIQFPSSVELSLAACDLFMALQDDPNRLESLSNSTCIESLLTWLGTDNKEVALRASTVIALLVSKVFTASGQVLQIPNTIQRLIFCLSASHSEPQIQVNVCLILEGLIAFEDVSVPLWVAESGGVHAICNAMEVNAADRILVEHCCRVLSFTIPCLDPNTVSSTQIPLQTGLSRVLDAYIDFSSVESAVMDAFWACCSQDDQFKQFLVAEHYLRSIIVVMQVHLKSAEVQRSGCSLLWLLSGYGNGNQLIGECGGVSAILNAMLFHNESTAVQKEGLTALKNLATEPSNKPRIEEADGVQVVTYSLWINYQDTLVIGSALSALNNIAVNSATKTVAPIPPEVLQFVIIAMKRFGTDEQLQSNACFYLKSCSYLRDNRQLMADRSEELIPLLQRAAATFPQSCHDRAGSVIKKLQR